MAAETRRKYPRIFRSYYNKNNEPTLYYMNTTREFFLFQLKPIYKLDPNHTETSVKKKFIYNDPIAVTLSEEKVLFQADPPKSNNDWCRVLVLSPIKHLPFRVLKWTISHKNGFIKTIHNGQYILLRNYEDYYYIRVVYKSVFYAIIKLKVLLHRVRHTINNKKQFRLCLLGTQDKHSILQLFKFVHNTPIKQRVARFLY